MELPAQHAEALRLSDEADRHLQDGDVARALSVYAEAAALEEQVLKAIPREKLRTVGIIGISTAALWYDSAQFAEAVRVAESLLELDGLDPVHRTQLDEIIASVPVEVAATGTHGANYARAVSHFDRPRRTNVEAQLRRILGSARTKLAEATLIQEKFGTVLRQFVKRRYYVPEEDLDDILNTVLYKYHVARDAGRIINVDKGVPTLSWFMSVASHTAADYWRRRKRVTELFKSLEDEDVGFDPTSALDAHIDGQELLSRLSAPCRRLLTMYYIDGATVVEIASEMSLTVAAVGRRLKNCLARARTIVVEISRRVVDPPK
jgi:RNA polymerase sigma factor (sigma-70 family)